MIASPCINVCQMDAAGVLCKGCFRTLEEIAAWAASDDATRRAILSDVACRRQPQTPDGNSQVKTPLAHD